MSLPVHAWGWGGASKAIAFWGWVETVTELVVESVGGAGGAKGVIDWLTLEEEDDFMVLIKIFLILEALKNGEELL